MNKKDFLHYILTCYVSITRDRYDTRLGFCTYIDISRVSRACYKFVAGLPDIYFENIIKDSLYHCDYKDVILYVKRKNRSSYLMRCIIESYYGRDDYMHMYIDVEDNLVYFTDDVRFCVGEHIVLKEPNGLHIDMPVETLSTHTLFEHYKTQKQISFDEFCYARKYVSRYGL